MFCPPNNSYLRHCIRISYCVVSPIALQAFHVCIKRFSAFKGNIQNLTLPLVLKYLTRTKKRNLLYYFLHIFSCSLPYSRLNRVKPIYGFYSDIIYRRKIQNSFPSTSTLSDVSVRIIFGFDADNRHFFDIPYITRPYSSFAIL